MKREYNVMFSKSLTKIHSIEYAAVCLVPHQHVCISTSRGTVGKRCWDREEAPQAFPSSFTKGSPPSPHRQKVDFCDYFRFHFPAGNLDIILP